MLTSDCLSRYLAVVVAAVECLFFGITLNGWPSLVYLIKNDAIFRYLCYNVSSSHAELEFVSPSNLSEEQVPKGQSTCIEEDAMYNLAYTLGSVLKFMTFLPAAFLIDRVGFKFTRVLGCAFTIGGGLMLGFCSKEHPYLLISGCSLVGVSGPLFILSNLQIANAFKNSKATVLSILGAAQGGAVTVHLLFKFLSDYASISWNTSFLIWGSSASLTLLPTFLLLPKVLTNSRLDAKVAEEAPSGKKSNELQETSSIEVNDSKCSKVNYNSIEKELKSQKRNNSFLSSLLSFSFIIHCYSLVICNINLGLYNGSYNWWVNEVAKDDSIVSSLTNMLGIVSMFKVLIAPFGGMLMDYLLAKYKKGNADVRGAGFIPLLICAVCQTAVAASSTIDSLLSIRISVFLFPFAQASYIVCAFSYTRHRFPRDHYNRLIGVFHLVAALEPLVQYSLFRLLMSKGLVARMINLGLIGISFLNPFHLLCLPKSST